MLTHVPVSGQGTLRPAPLGAKGVNTPNQLSMRHRQLTQRCRPTAYAHPWCRSNLGKSPWEEPCLERQVNPGFPANSEICGRSARCRVERPQNRLTPPSPQKLAQHGAAAGARNGNSRCRRVGCAARSHHIGARPSARPSRKNPSAVSVPVRTGAPDPPLRFSSLPNFLSRFTDGA